LSDICGKTAISLKREFNSSWKNFVALIGLTEPMRALSQKECNNEN